MQVIVEKGSLIALVISIISGGVVMVNQFIDSSIWSIFVVGIIMIIAGIVLSFWLVALETNRWEIKGKWRGGV